MSRADRERAIYMNKLAQIKESLLREHPELFCSQNADEPQMEQILNPTEPINHEKNFALSAYHKINAQLEAENQAAPSSFNTGSDITNGGQDQSEESDSQTDTTKSGCGMPSTNMIMPTLKKQPFTYLASGQEVSMIAQSHKQGGFMSDFSSVTLIKEEMKTSHSSRPIREVDQMNAQLEQLKISQKVPVEFQQ